MYLNFLHNIHISTNGMWLSAEIYRNISMHRPHTILLWSVYFPNFKSLWNPDVLMLCIHIYTCMCTMTILSLLISQLIIYLTIHVYGCTCIHTQLTWITPRVHRCHVLFPQAQLICSQSCKARSDKNCYRTWNVNCQIDVNMVTPYTWYLILYS